MDSNLNSLTNNKIQDQSKFKVLTDDKLNLCHKMISIINRVEDILRKGDNTGNMQFSFSKNVSKKLLSPGLDNLELFKKKNILSRTITSINKLTQEAFENIVICKCFQFGLV